MKYSVSMVSAAAASAAPYASFNAGSTRRARICELGVFTRAATLSNIVIGHPANEATPPVATGAVTPQPHDPADTAAALARIAATWSTAPTAPTVPLYQFTLGAAVGAGFTRKFVPNTDDCITLGLSGWLTIFNPTGGSTGSALDVYVEFDE
jgi:hypothetical protein